MYFHPSVLRIPVAQARPDSDVRSDPPPPTAFGRFRRAMPRPARFTRRAALALAVLSGAASSAKLRLANGANGTAAAGPAGAVPCDVYVAVPTVACPEEVMTSAYRGYI